jgi:hypothetical protein
MELFLALFLLFMKRERSGWVEVRTWLRRLTLGTADERFRLHQTERGWGCHHDQDKYSLDGSLRDFREYQCAAFVLGVNPRGRGSRESRDRACCG